jgi:ferredoxin
VAKLVVDKDECTGCELCTQTAPDVFEMKDDVCYVKDQNAGTKEEIQEAIDSCPAECITWQD